MAFDLTASYFNDIKERPVAAAAPVPITEEAQVLVYVPDGAGGSAVQPSAGAPGELFAGFAITDALKVVTEVVVETFNIPAAGPFTVQLRNQNIIVASAYVYNNTAAAAMVFNAVPAAGQYLLVTTGLMTFNVANAGNNVTITYRYNLTLQQIIEKYHQRSVNNTAQDYFSTVSVGCLEGEIFTTMFDTSQAYAVNTPLLTGAGGLVTSAVGGDAVGIVSRLPSVNYGYLGVKFRSVH